MDSNEYRMGDEEEEFDDEEDDADKSEDEEEEEDDEEEEEEEQEEEGWTVHVCPLPLNSTRCQAGKIGRGDWI